MALTDMKVFDRYVAEATIETVAQQVEVFNAASAGAITLSTEGFTGDFMHEIMWKSVHAAQRRVDRYAALATATPTALAQIDETGVKVAGGFGPISWEPAQLTYMQRNPAEAVEMASRNMAEAIIRDMLNTGIAAAVGAFGNQAGAFYDATTAKVTYAALNTGHALFGDRSSALVVDVMDGATYHKLIGLNLANAQSLFNYGGVTVVEILGKRVVVTDAPALFLDSTTDQNRVLSLVAGGITCHNAGDLITNTQVANGQTRITATFQADYTYGVTLKGYAWDVTNGGKSPTDAEIATGTNWDMISTSLKDTAGVLISGDV